MAGPRHTKRSVLQPLAAGSIHVSCHCLQQRRHLEHHGRIVVFTIPPAWFQTTWFLPLCAAACLACCGPCIRVRVRILRGLSARASTNVWRSAPCIARDLHDTLLQTIQGSRLVADSALKRSADPLRMREALEQLSIWLARATTEGRAALNLLRTSSAETNDLAEAFHRATEECRTENSMETSFSVVGDARDMHPIVRDEVYRVGYEESGTLAYIRKGANCGSRSLMLMNSVWTLRTMASAWIHWSRIRAKRATSACRECVSGLPGSLASSR